MASPRPNARNEFAATPSKWAGGRPHNPAMSFASLLPALALAAMAQAEEGVSFPETPTQARERAGEVWKRIEALEGNPERRDLATLDEIRMLTALGAEYSRIAALLSREEELDRRRVELPARRRAAEEALRSSRAASAPSTPVAPTEEELNRRLAEIEDHYRRFVDIHSQIEEFDRLAEGVAFFERESASDTIAAAERTRRNLLLGRTSLGPKLATIEAERAGLEIEFGKRMLKLLDKRVELAPESLAVARLERDVARAEIAAAREAYELQRDALRGILTQQLESTWNTAAEIRRRARATANRAERAILALEADAEEQLAFATQARLDAIGRGVDPNLSGFAIEVRARLASIQDQLNSNFQELTGTVLAEMYRAVRRFQTSKMVKDFGDEVSHLRSVESRSRIRASAERSRVEAFEDDESFSGNDFVKLLTKESEERRAELQRRYAAVAARYLDESRARTYALRSLADAAKTRAGLIEQIIEELDSAELHLRRRALFARVPSRLGFESVVKAARDAVGFIGDFPETLRTLSSNVVNFVRTPGHTAQVLLAIVLLPLSVGLVFFTRHVARGFSVRQGKAVDLSLVERTKLLAASLAYQTSLIGFAVLAAVIGVRLFEASPAIVRVVDASALVVFLTRLAVAVAEDLFQPGKPELRILPIDDAVAKFAWRVVYLAALSIFAVAVPRQVLSASGYGGRNHEFLELLGNAQRGLLIAAIVLLCIRKSVLDGLISSGEHPAWRVGRTALVRLRPIILVVAIAIFVLPILGFPFFGAFLESIALGAILIIGGATFGHRAVQELWRQYSPRWDLGPAGSHEASARRELLDQIVHWVSLLFFVAAAYVAFVSILRVGKYELGDVDIGVIGGRRLSAFDVAACLAIFGGSFLLASWTRRTLMLFAFPLTRLDVGTGYAIAVTASYLVVLGGVVAACFQLGLRPGDFAILLGAAGFGIGLGMQEAAGNFLSGLVLLFSRPVKVGDVIESESRIGIVTDINIVSTLIVTAENHQIRIPNREIVGRRLVNQSGNEPKIRASCRVGVAYGTDIDRARSVILAAVKQLPGVHASPPPQVIVDGIGDSAIQMDIYFWTGVGIYEREEVLSRVMSTTVAALLNAGIEIPYPRRDVALKGSMDGGGKPLGI